MRCGLWIVVCTAREEKERREGRREERGEERGEGMVVFCNPRLLLV